MNPPAPFQVRPSSDIVKTINSSPQVFICKKGEK